MVALTMNRWVADTTFQFVLRVGGTLQGALLGLVVWYIANGNSDTGVWWGMGLVCAFVVSQSALLHFRKKILLTSFLVSPHAILPTVLPHHRPRYSDHGDSNISHRL
jgi:uncharacterized membrane protein YccC